MHTTYRDTNISELKDYTLASIDIIKGSEDKIIFKCINGAEYHMFHNQDCCESVYIEDICGDINDLIGVPLVRAEVVESEASKRDEDEYFESGTWTFYKLAGKSDVTIRWLGTSNGYYSESVGFVCVKEPKMKELLL